MNTHTETKHTPGPWCWRKMGQWVLCTVHSGALIVLDSMASRRDSKAEFRVRDQQHCLMVPFDPMHPDARLIVAAPELLEALKTCVVSLDGTRNKIALAAAKAAIAKATEGAQ